jgi:predicted transcriptional regulator
MGKLSDAFFADDLFGEPLARNTDPITSHQAAADTARHVRADRRHVLEIHARHPAGLTDFELAAICDRQQTSVGKRRGELRDAGLIEQTESRRAAPSGSSAIVWRITPAGRELLRRLELA